MRNWARALLVGVALSGTVAKAEISLPHLIDDGMVLQRDTAVTVWGWADQRESVSVHFQGERHDTEADDEGRWQVTLPAMEAGGPYDMTLKGDNTLEVRDILVGDVWLASGQSNMELPMERTKPLYGDEMAEADYPRIRYFEVPDHYQFKHPEKDLEGGEWVSVTPETLPSISAVGYFFAKSIHQSREVPVGIINSALGGSPAEAWLSEKALKAFPEHREEARRFQDDELIERITEEDQARSDAWFEKRDEQDAGLKDGEPAWAAPGLDDSDWDTTTLPGAWGREGEANGVWWLRKTVSVPEDWAGQPAFLEMGRLVDADEVFVNGEKVGETGYQYPPRWYTLPEDLLRAGDNTIAVRLTSQSGRPAFIEDKPYELRWEDERIDLTGDWRLMRGARLEALAPPTFIRWQPMGLYNGMIAPLTDYALKGVIWYQGESNVGRADEYAELFPALIRDWRRQWDQKDQPFLFVQLANYLETKERPRDSDWARLREAQDSALSLPHTGMAVAIDVGEWNDIHPLNKKAVGERLALAAGAVAYDDEAVAYGPRYRDMEVEGDRITLSFDYVGSGLSACNDQPLAEFAIAGDDRRFVWADARLKGDRVVVHSDRVSDPVAVRYAWADNPDEANLCNREGLPAAPFRTDHWDKE